MIRISSLVCGFVAAFALMSGAFEFGRADAGGDYVITSTEPVGFAKETLVAQADVPSDAGPATEAASAPSSTAAADAPAAAPAAATSSPTTAPATASSAPQASDVGMMTKLYKNGAFFALGIMGLFIGLSIWSKLDKKHAFYIATALGGVGLLVESIRKGDTPNATSVMMMLLPTVGIMMRGPGHVKASPS